MNRRAVQAYGADNLARANSNPSGGGGAADAATRSAEQMAKLGQSLTAFSGTASALASALTSFGTAAEKLAAALEKFPAEVTHQHKVEATVVVNDSKDRSDGEREWVMSYVNKAIQESIGRQFPDANSGYPGG